MSELYCKFQIPADPCIKYCRRTCGDNNSTTKYDERTDEGTYGQGQNFMPCPHSDGGINMSFSRSLIPDRVRVHMIRSRDIYTSLFPIFCYHSFFSAGCNLYFPET